MMGRAFAALYILEPDLANWTAKAAVGAHPLCAEQYFICISSSKQDAQKLPQAGVHLKTFSSIGW